MKRTLTPKPVRKRTATGYPRRCTGLLLTCVVSILMVACPGSYEMDRDEPCRQAGFAIASRKQACTGDADLANALYDQFVEEYACGIEKLSKNQYRCAYNINALDCQEVERRDDNLPQYLIEDGCFEIMSRKDGVPMLLKTPDSEDLPPQASAQCGELLLLLASLESACFGGGDPGSLYILISNDLATDHTCDISAGDAELATCRADLEGARCIDFSIARDLLDATPSCQVLLKPKAQAKRVSGEGAQ